MCTLGTYKGGKLSAVPCCLLIAILEAVSVILFMLACLLLSVSPQSVPGCIPGRGLHWAATRLYAIRRAALSVALLQPRELVD